MTVDTTPIEISNKVLDPKSWTQPHVNVVNRWVADPIVVSASAVQTQRE